MKYTILFAVTICSIVSVNAQQFISNKIYTAPVAEKLENKTIIYQDGEESQTNTEVFGGKAAYKVTIKYKKSSTVDSFKTFYLTNEQVSKSSDGKYTLMIDNTNRIFKEKAVWMQNGTDSTIATIEEYSRTPKQHRFGIFGYGNLNQENEKRSMALQNLVATTFRS